MTDDENVTQVEPQPGAIKPDIGPTNNNAIRDASKIALGTDVEGTETGELQKEMLGGENAPGANLDDLNTDKGSAEDNPDVAEGHDESED